MLTSFSAQNSAAYRSVRHAERLRRSLGRLPRCPLTRARKGGRREQEEDVEIFNIDDGWLVEAVPSSSSSSSNATAAVSAGSSGTDALTTNELTPGAQQTGVGWPARLQGSAAEFDSEGWSVESVDFDDDLSEFKGDFEDLDFEDDDDGDDVWQLAAAGAAGAAAAAAGSGRRRRAGGAEAAEPSASLPRALHSMPRHMLRELERQQREAAEEAARLRPSERKKAAARQKTHQRLRIISGTAAGRRLVSPQGDQTRPMMEMVRGAVFNMLMSLYGCQGAQLPEDTRWLDLFAGTGAIGIEALSRGCGEAHFVEASPWVVSNCLLPNLEACEVESDAVVHTTRAEEFLQKALQLPAGRFAGGAFDFVSVCPPYMLVSYEELYDLLEGSPLLHEESIVIVEYPKKLAHLIRDTLGPLSKLRDRRYGRTFIAIYGPGGAGAEEA